MTISFRPALVAAIATAAAFPGAALAMPVDGGTSPVSAVQDLRSADTRPPLADQLRGHSAAATPTWPKHPAVIASAPRALPDSGDGGEPWLAIGAGLAGAGLVLGGAAAIRRPARRHAAI